MKIPTNQSPFDSAEISINSNSQLPLFLVKLIPMRIASSARTHSTPSYFTRTRITLRVISYFSFLDFSEKIIQVFLVTTYQNLLLVLLPLHRHSIPGLFATQ